MNAAELLQSVSDPGNTIMSGLLVGCIMDTSVGELSFLISKQDTGFRFKVFFFLLNIYWYALHCLQYEILKNFDFTK